MVIFPVKEHVTKTVFVESAQMALIINVFVIWAGQAQIVVLTADVMGTLNAMSKLENVTIAQITQGFSYYSIPMMNLD